MKYLRNAICLETIYIIEVCVQSLARLHSPDMISELGSFLGVGDIYMRFVPGYTDIAAALNQLLKESMQNNEGL